MISRIPRHFMLTEDLEQFQSRNRGSFDFKGSRSRWHHRFVRHGFNLVIEVLLISSPQGDVAHRNIPFWFQSRNRGSFDFKCSVVSFAQRLLCRFNLVIEVLLISRKCKSLSAPRHQGFNLVIEVLLISSIGFGILKPLKYQVSIS